MVSKGRKAAVAGSLIEAGVLVGVFSILDQVFNRGMFDWYLTVKALVAAFILFGLGIMLTEDK